MAWKTYTPEQITGMLREAGAAAKRIFSYVTA